MKKKKIVVVGLGYVGLSNSILLAQKNTVIAVDINIKKVNLINNGKSPFFDDKVEGFLKNKKLDLTARLPASGIYEKSDFVVVSTPTNYDESTHFFNTDSVEETIKNVLDENSEITIIIRSTVPVGFTEQMIKKYRNKNIYFVPEFLREGNALEDTFNPTRIIIGSLAAKYEAIKKLFLEGTNKKNIKVIEMSPSEAESSKLWSNSYLAMRVAFFNELDSFAQTMKLNTKNIIDSLSLDPRIGSGYNNPSFGYGGYCLPKDTKQLSVNFKNSSKKLIDAIIKSNKFRKKFIAEEIIKLDPKIVGIYRVTMKEGSDNFRESSVQEVIKIISSRNIKILIYEPLIQSNYFNGFEVVKDFEKFANNSKLIIANRVNSDLRFVMDKVYTRDIFNRD